MLLTITVTDRETKLRSYITDLIFEDDSLVGFVTSSEPSLISLSAIELSTVTAIALNHYYSSITASSSESSDRIHEAS